MIDNKPNQMDGQGSNNNDTHTHFCVCNKLQLVVTSTLYTRYKDGQ